MLPNHGGQFHILSLIPNSRPKGSDNGGSSSGGGGNTSLGSSARRLNWL
ncbi:MAG: hypothetical protein KBD64_03840 [Gammaproteobacteria bacterium]|nr:hypothetical protein [Gammaproteobacteria bacterium]